MPDRFFVIAHYFGKKGTGETILEYLQKLAAESRKETSNLSYEFFRSVENEDHFVIIESYIDEEVFVVHRDSLHFRELGKSKIIPLLESRKILSTTINVR